MLRNSVMDSERVQVKWETYKMLNSSHRRLVKQVGDGSIIRRFEKTPYPERETDVICPHFMELAWSWGCPYNCAFCYLKGTYRWPYFKKGENGRILPHFKDRNKIKKHCTAFIEQVHTPEILNSGELSDSLMQEKAKNPWSVFIQGLFEGTPHRILHLSKGTAVANFVKNDWQENAIMSWSINAPEVSEAWEKLTPDPLKRLDAAKKVYEAGYQVRLRIDPIVPVVGWQVKYCSLIDEIFKREILPDVITMGTLRGLLSTLAHVKNHSWERFLNRKHGMTSWGYKPSFAARYQIYRTLIDHLDSYGFNKAGLCKETLRIWKALGLSFEKITCNCIAIS